MKYGNSYTCDEIGEKQKLSGEGHMRVSEPCVELSDENLKWVYGGVRLLNMTTDTITNIKNTMYGVIPTYP
jgi:hypothetical protein